MLALGARAAEPEMPRVAARLSSAHEAVAPGGATRLALQIEIEKDWHLYHPITLGGGLPTEVEWTLPAGASIGNVRFPAPALKTFQGEEYLGYEKTVVVLADLKLDSTAPAGDALEISAKVSGLACKEACVIIATDATLKLPVARELGPAANAKLFESAAGKLPPPLAEAPHLEGSRVLVSHERLAVGEPGELAAVLKIEPKHHINDPRPGVEDLIPSRFYFQTIDGVDIGTPRWPTPVEKEVKGIGKARWHGGETIVRIPLRISDANFEPRPITVHLLIEYQACSDDGTCYPPIMAEAFASFEVVPAGTKTTRSTAAVFATPLVPLPDNGAANSAGAGGSPADGVSSAISPRVRISTQGVSLWWVFLGAFLGGMILNVMPCVLPVLSLKIFSFMQQAGDEPERILRMGLVYAAGIMASFFVLAIVMVSAGMAWGGLMQEPPYVITLAALVFAFALSLLGVFELRLPGVVENVAGAVTTREGYGGAFLNGIVATALATPCVGPFLGSAMGVLVQLPPLVAGLGIMTVGVGLAAPYVLLTAFPAWLRFLPRPGHWMITFKQIMGFVLMATVIWLLWILASQVAPEALIATLVVLCAIGVGCWLIGTLGLNASHTRHYVTWGGALAVVAAGWFVGFHLLDGARALGGPASNGAQTAAAGPNGDGSGITWQTWHTGLPEELAQKGFTVYVDFTAKWCLTCQSNKKLVLQTEPIVRAVRERNIVMLKADFTRKDPAIKDELRRFARAGVPLNVIYPAGRPDDVIVLPELLTQDIVRAALDRAGASTTTLAQLPALTP